MNIKRRHAKDLQPGRPPTPDVARDSYSFSSPYIIDRRLGGQRGTVLIVSMWIIAFLAGLVIAFSWSSRIDLVTSANYVSSVKADAAVRSGIRLLQYYASNMAGSRFDPEFMEAEAVDAGEGLFWFIRYDPEDEVTVRYGIYDEGSKLNINTATEEMLAKLPGMNDSLAAAIVEWRGRTSASAPSTVELDSYLFLPEPYYRKSAPFETVEELMLVQGMTKEILYGDNLNSGIMPFVTVYSMEPNASPSSGQEMININDRDQQALLRLVRETVEDAEEAERIVDRIRRGRPFRNIIDFYLRSGLPSEDFQEIEERLISSDSANIPGRINILTAPREVIFCLPGIEESDADSIIAARSSIETESLSIAWVAEALPEEKAIAVGGLVTTRSYQFSAEILATGPDGRAFKRHLVVVDARGQTPRIVYQKNITYKGWPLEAEILDDLRAGKL